MIGTVWQAVENGAEVFFLFNNPADVLARHIERSRQVIEDARVTKLDLFCCPTALTGSTRMQATTSEPLVAGAASGDRTGGNARPARLNPDSLCAPTSSPARRPHRVRNDYVEEFAGLLAELGQPNAVSAMAAMVEFEELIYRRRGLVTYMADLCLLDIFTDTTERSPTFMLPKFPHG